MKKQQISSWRGELIQCPMQRNHWLTRDWCQNNQSMKRCGGCPYNEGIMPIKPESNVLFRAVEMITKDLYTIGEGVTRLPPLPGTPEKIQRIIEDRAMAKRFNKNLKRIDNWRGAK